MLPGDTGLYQGIASFNENAVLGIYGGSRTDVPTTVYGWATPNNGPIDTIARVIGGPQVVINNVAKYFTNDNDFDEDGIYSPAKFITDKLPLSGGPGATSYKMVVNFASPVADVAFYALDIDAAIGTTTAESFWAIIYDGNGSVVQEKVVRGDYSDAAYYVEFGNTVGITKLEMWFTRDAASLSPPGTLPSMTGGGGIDYLSFTPVPEPATMFLLGFGLIGVGVFVRRKFKR
jgi:hypothetical protein